MEARRVTQIPADVWLKLGSELGIGEGLVARQALPDVEPRLVAAIDRDGRRHILVSLAGGDAAVEDTQSRGVSISTQTLNGPGGQATRFIDVLCIDASGHGALDVIGGEIAERLACGMETPAQCVSRVIAKWRRFWGAAISALLSKEEQIGLFAELWFLLYWLIPRAGVDATSTWRGPFGSRHDFEGVLNSVEVKGTTSPLGPVHRINSLTQLDPPELGSLWLFSLQMREEAGATNTLPGMIDLLREALSGDAAMLDHFERVIDSAGYSPIHNSEYDRTRWRVVEELLFPVSASFPRITSTSFNAGVPVGVESLSYVINLSGFRELCVARSPAEDFPLDLNS